MTLGGRLKNESNAIKSKVLAENIREGKIKELQHHMLDLL